MTQTGDAGRPAASDGTRLAELLAVLSLATDLGLGAPLERGLRTTIAALRIVDLAAVTGDELRDLYHTLFLIMIGCTSSSGSEAALFGDEFVAGRGLSPLAMGSQQQMLSWIVRNAGEGEPPLQRAGRLVRVVTAAGQMAESQAGHCEVAQRMAQRLALGSGVVALLGAVFERWDGRGQPGRLRGEQLPLGIRIGQVAYDLVVQQSQGLGRDAVLARVRGHAGKGLDPQLVGLVEARAGEVFEAVEVSSAWETVLAAEPRLWRYAGEAGVASAALVIADFADLKSSYFRGHSRSVAWLAAAAAGQLGLDTATAGQVRLAGLVHDLGRVTVSAGVWDRPGPLTMGNGNRCVCMRTGPSGCSGGSRRWLRLAVWPGCTTSGSTGPVTTGAWRRRRCRCPRGSWPPLTCARRCSRTGRTGPLSARTPPNVL